MCVNTLPKMTSHHSEEMLGYPTSLDQGRSHLTLAFSSPEANVLCSPSLAFQFSKHSALSENLVLQKVGIHH